MLTAFLINTQDDLGKIQVTLGNLNRLKIPTLVVTNKKLTIPAVYADCSENDLLNFSLKNLQTKLGGIIYPGDKWRASRLAYLMEYQDYFVDTGILYNDRYLKDRLYYESSFSKKTLIDRQETYKDYVFTDNCRKFQFEGHFDFWCKVSKEFVLLHIPKVLNLTLTQPEVLTDEEKQKIVQKYA